MANSFDKLTERTKQHLHGDDEPTGDDEIVAVVNTIIIEDAHAAHGLSYIVASIFGLWGMLLAALPFARLGFKKLRTDNEPETLSEQVKFRTFLLVFRRNRLDVHRNKSRHRPGDLVTSFGYDDVSYGRHEKPGGLATETFVRVNGIEFPVNGWFERDLRKTVAPLGVTLQAIGGAAPTPKVIES